MPTAGSSGGAGLSMASMAVFTESGSAVTSASAAALGSAMRAFSV